MGVYLHYTFLPHADQIFKATGGPPNRSGRVYRLTRTGDHQAGGSQPPTASSSSHPLFPHHLLSPLTPPTHAHCLPSSLYPFVQVNIKTFLLELTIPIHCTLIISCHTQSILSLKPFLTSSICSYNSLHARLATPLKVVLSTFPHFYNPKPSEGCI